MNISGGNNKPKPKLQVLQKPQRTPREWREITNMKLRQYETINFMIMGKKSRMSYGD